MGHNSHFNVELSLYLPLGQVDKHSEVGLRYYAE
jgi:hypothetical protein